MTDKRLTVERESDGVGPTSVTLALPAWVGRVEVRAMADEGSALTVEFELIATEQREDTDANGHR